METIPLNLFQLHLERVSNYLTSGEGIWWHHRVSTNEIEFHDGDNEPDYLEQGPPLLSFTDTSMVDAVEMCAQCWNDCVEKQVKLPIPEINVYDQEGEFRHKRKFTRESYDDSIDHQENVEIKCIDENPLDEQSLLPSPLPSPLPTSSASTTVVNQLKSKTARAVEQVIGMSKNLSLYDKYLCDYKLSNSKFSKRMLTENLIPLQTQILKSLSENQAIVEKWEKDYFLKHATTPMNNDIIKSDSGIKDHFNKITIAKKLLKKWNIKF